MRILFLAHRLPYPPNKGDKIRSFRALQMLSERHEVDLFCFYDDRKDTKYLRDLQAYCRHIYAEPLSWFASRIRAALSVLMGHPFTLGFFHSFAMQQRVLDSLKREPFDLVFVYGSAMAQYVEAVKTSLPCLLDIVDVDSDKWKQYAQHALPPLAWLYEAEARSLARYEDHLVRDFPRLVVCTEREAELLRKRASSFQNVSVLENAPPLELMDGSDERILADAAAHRPYIVFTGSMDYLPNIDAAVYFAREIFPAIRKEAPEIQLVIVGRNPVRAVRQLAQIPGIRVTGPVRDVYPYLRAAAVAVVPLRIACGLQFKILEAMAMGVPVIIGSKPAMALPSQLRRWVQIEDEPNAFARRTVQLVRHGTAFASEEMRRAVRDYYQKGRLQGELDALVAATLGRNTQLIAPADERGIAAKTAN